MLIHDSLPSQDVDILDSESSSQAKGIRRIERTAFTAAASQATSWATLDQIALCHSGNHLVFGRVFPDLFFVIDLNSFDTEKTTHVTAAAIDFLVTQTLLFLSTTQGILCMNANGAIDYFPASFDKFAANSTLLVLTRNMGCETDFVEIREGPLLYFSHTECAPQEFPPQYTLVDQVAVSSEVIVQGGYIDQPVDVINYELTIRYPDLSQHTPCKVDPWSATFVILDDQLVYKIQPTIVTSVTIIHMSWPECYPHYFFAPLNEQSSIVGFDGHSQCIWILNSQILQAWNPTTLQPEATISFDEPSEPLHLSISPLDGTVAIRRFDGDYQFDLSNPVQPLGTKLATTETFRRACNGQFLDLGT